MIRRIAQAKVQEMAAKMPIISITGPRQSGKTTLAKLAFANYTYINLELPENREFAAQDPNGFLNQYSNQVILDEVQHVPSLFSYLQVAVDKAGKNGMFILTGSNNFNLHQKISQSLAGRVYIFHLLPFSLNELAGKDISFERYEDYLYQGSYPRIYDQKINPTDYHPSYIETYLERDLRLTDNIQDLGLFRQFLQVCAGSIGQIVNLSAMGSRLGIDHKTVRRWLGILEAAYLIHRLNPWHKNFNKRIIRSPKLYFYDTGLACSLLQIKSSSELTVHFAFGSIFENMIINEVQKFGFNTGQRYRLHFWRDNHGTEVDLIIDRGAGFDMIEIKSARTIRAEFFRNLNSLKKSAGNERHRCFLIYGGDAVQHRTDAMVLSWRNLSALHD